MERSRRLPHGPLLGDRELVGGVSTDPRLDLHGDEQAVDRDQKVDLTAGARQVPRHQAGTTPAQETEGDTLADRP